LSLRTLDWGVLSAARYPPPGSPPSSLDRRLVLHYGLSVPGSFFLLFFPSGAFFFEPQSLVFFLRILQTRIGLMIPDPVTASRKRAILNFRPATGCIHHRIARLPFIFFFFFFFFFAYSVTLLVVMRLLLARFPPVSLGVFLWTRSFSFSFVYWRSAPCISRSNIAAVHLQSWFGVPSLPTMCSFILPPFSVFTLLIFPFFRPIALTIFVSSCVRPRLPDAKDLLLFLVVIDPLHPLSMSFPRWVAG